MRLKSENIFQFSFFENEEKIPLVVRQYRNEYRKIGNLLSQNSEIYNIVHRDFRALNKSKKGRRSIFSSENLLHALIIKQKEGINYREACIKISESTFLQDFCKLSMKGSIDYTLLCKAFNAIKPESWELINQHLALQSIKDKKINIDVIRTDSTVVETNIHWPTDSSLLWDTYRVIERMLKKINKIDSNTMLFRFHLKKIKSLHIYVTRYASSNSKKRQRQVIRKMKTLIKRTEIVISNAESV